MQDGRGMPSSSMPGERGRGRPRDTEKDEAIRAATWDVVARLGFGGLTFEAVAEAAGCTRATLYRRYRSKFDLIAAMFHETSRELEPPFPIEQAPREALIALIESTALFMSGERGAAILAIASASARMPELRSATDAYRLNERDLHWSIFRRLVPDATKARLDFVFNSLIGIMLSHVVLMEAKLDREQCAFIADTVILMLERE